MKYRRKTTIDYRALYFDANGDECRDGQEFRTLCSARAAARAQIGGEIARIDIERNRVTVGACGTVLRVVSEMVEEIL